MKALAGSAWRCGAAATAFAGALALGGAAARGQTMVDPALRARVVAQGLSTGFADLVSAFVFVDATTVLAATRADGRVRRIDLVAGSVAGPGAVVADLAIVAPDPADSQAEWGVQAMVLHPRFAENGWVYVRYDASLAPPADTAQASFAECAAATENVIDRFVWTPGANQGAGALVFDRRIRSSPMCLRYHHGGPMVFAPGGTLLVTYGDQRLSFDLAQNTSAATFYPDSACIARINDDGTLPADNPFPPTAPGAVAGTAAWWAYGFRNCYGAAIDPATGALWVTDNGEATYDEINRVPPGMNGGHRPISGPVGHPRQTGTTATLRLLPGAFYKDPEFAWFQTCGVTGLAFLHGSALGPGYDDRVLVGNYNSGLLWMLRLNAARDGFAFADAGLADRVDDRVPFSFDPRQPSGLPGNREARELLAGTGFGGVFSGALGVAVAPDGQPHVLTATGRLIRIERWCVADIVSIGGFPPPDGSLTVDDYTSFVNAFAGEEALADVVSIGGFPPRDGELTVDDYTSFINAFAEGCS